MNNYVENRISWIDNAKGIGILLVMLGHTRGIFGHSNFIYSFHMPLFFFLSGYLLSSDSLKLSLISFVRKLHFKIIIPYLFFWVISYLYWFPINRIRSNNSMRLYDPFIGILYGINEYLYPNVVLWYFTCLFVTYLIFYSYYKIIGKKYFLIIVAILSLGAAYVFNLNTSSIVRLPWNLDVALVVVFFFALGYFCKKNNIINKLAYGGYAYNIIGFLLCSVVLYFTAKWNGTVFVSSANFQNPIIFFIATHIGIMMVIYVSHLIPQNKYCEWLSTSTMILFPLHQLFYSMFTGIGLFIFRLPHTFNTLPLIDILYLVLAIIFSIPVAFILKRYFPWTIGIRCG